jgi:transcription initiation factor TFIID subunit 8
LPSLIGKNEYSFPNLFYFDFQTHKQPVTEYEAIREKAASQKRDLERALVKFVAKTGETDSLFLTADNVFPCEFLP